MPATRCPVRSAPCFGFTLLELLLVLAIAGLLMAVTPPMLSSAFPGLQLKGTTRQVAAGLRQARDRAIAEGAERVVTLDLEERLVRVPGSRPIPLPAKLEVELVTARSELQSGERGNIRFFPDGSSTGGRITLSYRKAGYDLDLDWLTGRLRLSTLTPGER